jgi:hypothetical protein
MAGVAVILYTYIREVIGSNTGPGKAILTEACCAFPQSLQPNSGIVSRLGHHCVFENTFQFIIC